MCTFHSLSINFKVREGQIFAVVGHVGSGKSSLMAACLGELERLKGSITIKVIIKCLFQPLYSGIFAMTDFHKHVWLILRCTTAGMYSIQSMRNFATVVAK